MTLRHYRVDGERYHGVMQSGERATEDYSAIVVARSADDAWDIFTAHVGDDLVPSMEASIASTHVIPRRRGVVDPL